MRPALPFLCGAALLAVTVGARAQPAPATVPAAPARGPVVPQPPAPVTAPAPAPPAPLPPTPSAAPGVADAPQVPTAHIVEVPYYYAAPARPPTAPARAQGVPTPVPTYPPPAAPSQYGYGGYAPPDTGDRRQRRRDRRRLRLAPPRVTGHRVGVDILPQLGGESYGILLRSQWLTRFKYGLWLRARVGPVGVAIADRDSVGVADFAITGGWEHKLFAIGGGAGAALVRIEQATRRTRGASGTGLVHVRIGALDGLHFSWRNAWAPVDGHNLGVMTQTLFRFPIGNKQSFLDFEVASANPLAWLLLNFSYELGFGPDPRTGLRIRPTIGVVEVIDQVRRDGGPGFTIGVGLVYRMEDPP